MTQALITMPGTESSSVFYVLNRSEMGIQLGMRGIAEPSPVGVAVGVRIRAARIPKAKVKASNVESTVKQLYPRVVFNKVSDTYCSGTYVVMLPYDVFKPGIIEELEGKGVFTKLHAQLAEHFTDVYMDQPLDEVWDAVAAQITTALEYGINKVTQPAVPYVYHKANAPSTDPTSNADILPFIKPEPGVDDAKE